MSKSPERLAPGTLVREYKIKRLLGEGGMGEVYLAQHTYTQQEVAVKAVSPLLMRDEAVRRRFLEEGRVLAMLKHPNIVLLYTFFEEAAQFFLVMEYVEGQSIEQWLASHSGGQPVPTDRVLAIMEHVLEGLAYAHRQQPPVVHRDVKPANVLLDRAGRAVVTDFGIAKAMGREKLTRTGGVVGTFEYMSPEQVRGEDVTPATDVYSAGIMLYRMLTGVVPFPQTSTTGFECMDAHIRQLPPSLQVTRPDLPASLAEVVRKSLEKEPALRYRNAGEMLCALRSVDFSCPADRP
ncbi:MAG: serine/threonine protein kinase, partial [Deltaproteobacteria bacterium]|nr:serine/threonine protein kinase [Deltaproteobacteria bacterium]